MRLTKEGTRFILTTVLIAVAAVNTGNNLIYLILSLMLSLMLLAVVMLRMNLSNVTLSASMNPPVFAGEPTPAILRLGNDGRLMSSYSVAVSTPSARSPVYFGHVPKQSFLKKGIKLKFNKRGIYGYGAFKIRSSFPFILLEKSVNVRVSGDIVVYPALRDVEGIISDVYGKDSFDLMRAESRGEEVYSIREFRYGDDWRNIHWKASAKASKLLTKEFMSTEMRKVTVIIDNILPSGSELFEKAVSLAGSLCRYFLDRGYLVRVLTCKKVIPYGSGNEQLFRILDILAILKEEDVRDCSITYHSDGFTVLVLKSGDSAMKRVSPSCDMVIYAADV
jgi:uncharacterized protein (DUF58 family)